MKEANLMWANLEGADLRVARLNGAKLAFAHLEGADLDRAEFILKSFWWRTGLARALSWIWGILGKDYSKRRPTIIKGADFRNVNLTADPLLYRELLDEQWLDRFAADSWRKPLYWFWLWTSNCGRSFGLVFLVAVLAGFVFGAVFADYHSPRWFPGWLQNLLAAIDPRFRYQDIPPGLDGWWPYYMSFVTMTSLGWASAQPVNKTGMVWHTILNLIGYALLGYFVSVLGAKLARRSA